MNTTDRLLAEIAQDRLPEIMETKVKALPSDTFIFGIINYIFQIKYFKPS